MEHIQEANKLLQYIKFGLSTDPEYYTNSIASKRRQLRFVYRQIRETYPDFAGLKVIEFFLS